MNRVAQIFLFMLIIIMFSVCLLAAQELPLWDNDSPMTRFLAQYYQVDPIVVISLGQRMRFPDDVSVAIYLAKAAEKNPMDMLEPRLKNKSWLEITQMHNIDPIIIFTPLTSKEKIPDEYKHAYREYNKHNQNSNYRMVLYDKEFRNLVQLKLVTEAFNKTPFSVMNSITQGENFTNIILRELESKENEKTEE